MSVVLTSVTITDPNWGGDSKCSTPDSASVPVRLTACAPDISGVEVTLSYGGEDTDTQSSDSAGLLAFNLPWWKRTYSVTVNTDTLPFRHVLLEGTTLQLDPNYTSSLAIGLAPRPDHDYICVARPKNVLVKGPLYLTDSVLGSFVLDQGGGTSIDSSLTTISSSGYTRSDGTTCPSGDITIQYHVDTMTGLLWIHIWADVNYCPRLQYGSQRLARASLPLTLDTSMFSSDVVMFRGTRDWSQPGYDQATVKNLHQYVYGFTPATYLLTE
jgi:hypothetical protein